MEQVNTRRYKPFGESLLFGNSAQDRVADAIRVAGGFANKVDDRARYDFELQFNNHVYRVEVKNEDNYAKSGNICVETRQGWPLRPSGVAWSEATLFVHTLCDNCVLYRRRDMHVWLRDEVAARHRYEQKFGDNNNRGFVLAIDDLLKHKWFDYCAFTVIANSLLWTF